MDLLNFTQFLEFIFILLLLFAICIYHVNCRIKVILDLTHFLSNHCLHIVIVVRYAIRCSVLDLAHDLIENLSLELLFEVLVNGAQARQPFESLADNPLFVMLKFLLKFCLSLLSRVFYLLNGRQ